MADQDTFEAQPPGSTKPLYCILSTISLVFIFVLEPSYSQSLFDSSLDYIVKI